MTSPDDHPLPTEADREALLSSGHPLSREGKETIQEGKWDNHHLIVAFARHAQQAREEALEQAARVMENLAFFTPIEELLEMTKQDLSVRTCHEGAKAIRNLSLKDQADD